MRTINTGYHTSNHNISYYLANALVYLVSERRKHGNHKTLDRSLTYLNKLYSHPSQLKQSVWDKAPVYDVGHEFKNLSHLVQHDHTSADIEKVIICLMALSDLILNKSDVTQVVNVLRSRQVMHELKYGLKLSLPDQDELNTPINGI